MHPSKSKQKSNKGSLIALQRSMITRQKPPQFQANIALARKYRFNSSSGATFAVTTNTLLFAAGTVAETNILAVAIFVAVRLKRIRIWGVAPTGGVPASFVSVSFNSGTANFGNQKEFRDDSINSSQPPYLSCTPPKLSLASDWVIGGNVTLFNLSCSNGSVIDVDVELVMGDFNNTVSGLTQATVGNTAGGVYYYPLDGRGGSYAPIGLTLGG